MKDVPRLSWHRYSLGYQVVEAQRTPDHPERELVVAHLPDEVGKGRYAPVDPDEQRAMFRMFAQTAPDPQGVVGFANRFGLLGVERDYYVLFFEDDEVAGTAEPLTVWQDEIALMRDAVDLWRSLPYRRWDRRIEDVLRRFTPLLPSPVMSPVVNQPPPPDPNGPLLRLLDHTIDRRRWRDVAQLLLDFAINEKLGHGTAVRVLPRSDERPLSLATVPKNLLGAMWLQFAEAATGRAEIRQCPAPGCAEWFSISREPGGCTRRRKFCSETCRVRAGDHKKARVRQLLSDGATPAEAAREVGITVVVVKRWAKGRGKTGKRT